MFKKQVKIGTGNFFSDFLVVLNQEELKNDKNSHLFLIFKHQYLAKTTSTQWKTIYILQELDNNIKIKYYNLALKMKIMKL